MTKRKETSSLQSETIISDNSQGNSQTTFDIASYQAQSYKPEEKRKAQKLNHQLQEIINEDDSNDSFILYHAIEQKYGGEALTFVNKLYEESFKKKVRRLLLTPYSNRDEDEYKEIITQFFEKEVSFLQETLDAKNFDSPEKHGACLYNFFLEFIDSKRFTNWGECKDILEWLKDNQIDEILEEKRQIKMINLLVLKNNWEAVQWVFTTFPAQQIQEIFTNNLIFNHLKEGNASIEQIKTIKLVFRKFTELLKPESKEIEIEMFKEQLKEQLEENHEEGVEVWAELKAGLDW